jgi:hypothetical protein
VTGPAAPPLPPELDALLRRTRLPCLRKAAPDVLATARAQRWEPAEVLRLARPVAGRNRGAALASQAALSPGRSLADRLCVRCETRPLSASRTAAAWAGCPP